MNKGDSSRLPVVLYLIFQQYTDPDHTITMNGPDGILARLQEYGIEAERKTIYNARNILQEAGVKIHQKRIGREYGYYMEHQFSPAEALVLSDAIAESASLSPAESSELHQKILSQMSIYQRKSMPDIFLSPAKTGNQKVLENIKILMDAAASHHKVRFLYYDLVVTDQAKTAKKYRKNQKEYKTEPYGITAGNGRMYCIFYSRVHQSPGYYRIDKMEDLSMLEETFIPVDFDIHAYVRRSIQMYSGTARTIKARFSRKIAANVFDEFGHDQQSLLITAVQADTFEAAVRTSLSPTVTGWFLQFYQDAVVLEPKEFQDHLLDIAETIEKNYNTDRKQRGLE